jgi:hypothetical protein
MKPKPNQLVAALTPVVFAPLAGVISVWAAKNAGVKIDESSLQAIFIAGATIATAKAALWLKGWQAYEKRLAVAPASDPGPGEGTATGDRQVAGPVGGGDDALDGIDGFLEDDLEDDLDDADAPVPAGPTG